MLYWHRDTGNVVTNHCSHHKTALSRRMWHKLRLNAHQVGRRTWEWPEDGRQSMGRIDGLARWATDGYDC